MPVDIRDARITVCTLVLEPAGKKTLAIAHDGKFSLLALRANAKAIIDNAIAEASAAAC